MSLKGSLDTMTLPDLLQWLGTARKTGVALLTQGAITKRLFMENGLVTGSVSNDPSDFLGQFLLSYGKITEEQLRDALESQQGSSDYLGTHLIRMGALSQAELTRMLSLKTEETIYSLFNWERAQFEYLDCPPESSPFPVALRIEDILLKGARRFDEMARVREQIPSSAAVPRRTQKPLPIEITQSANLKRIAEAVDGVRSVAAIALHTHTSEFLVSKFLFESLRAGVIEIMTATPAEPTNNGPGLTLAALKLFESGDYEAVITLVRHENIEGDEALRSVLQKAEEKFVQDAYRNSLRPDKVPSLLRSTSDLLGERLSPEEYFMISRIDGVWDVQSIIAVSPLREVDALHVLLRLEKRGFICLKETSAADKGSRR